MVSDLPCTLNLELIPKQVVDHTFITLRNKDDFYTFFEDLFSFFVFHGYSRHGLSEEVTPQLHRRFLQRFADGSFLGLTFDPNREPGDRLAILSHLQGVIDEQAGS